MIALLAAAAAGLGAWAGYRLGMLRAAVALLAALFGAGAAWNWGLPLAELLAGPKAPAAALVLAAGQALATALFAWLGLRAIAHAAALPPAFQRWGGAALGAAAAWVAFGALLAAFRALPAVNEFAIRQRGGAVLDHASPDGWWLGALEHASARGFAPFPQPGFDAARDFLPPRR